MAVAEEESMDEQDKGSLNYQESKVFHAEPFLCSVYENAKRRVYTFEVYGLDSQDMLHKQYTFQDFDQLFRFNAELMNPNRKEGRYHWVIERLEIAQVGQEKKLRLGNEVSKEVPEVPIYETNRKIPTGRMDMKERQRLREQMDMLQIKRDENIRNKREAAKQKFLEHIRFLKEEHARKEAEQEAAIEKEREARYKWQLDMDEKEEEEAIQTAARARNRRVAAENKDRAHEEKEEEDLRQLRLRWKAADAEKARHIKEARERKAKEDIRKAQEAKELAAHRAEIQAKREINFDARAKRVQKKKDALVKRALEVIPELQRVAQLKIERNAEYLQDWNERRWPVFQQVLLNAQERERAHLAEQDAVKAYHDARSIPQKEKTKGKHRKKDGKTQKKGAKDGKDDKDKAAPKKKSAKKDDKGGDTDGDVQTGDEGPGGKQEAERIVDGVEAKMRAEMEEAKRRHDLEKKRTDKIKEKEAKRIKDELKRVADYKKKVMDAEQKKYMEAKERHLVQTDKEKERRVAEERQQEEAKRLANVRARGVARYEEKQLEWLCSH